MLEEHMRDLCVLSKTIPAKCAALLNEELELGTPLWVRLEKLFVVPQESTLLTKIVYVPFQQCPFSSVIVWQGV